MASSFPAPQPLCAAQAPSRESRESGSCWGPLDMLRQEAGLHDMWNISVVLCPQQTDMRWFQKGSWDCPTLLYCYEAYRRIHAPTCIDQRSSMIYQKSQQAYSA